jgi:hypothetical protein
VSTEGRWKTYGIFGFDPTNYPTVPLGCPTAIEKLVPQDYLRLRRRCETRQPMSNSDTAPHPHPKTMRFAWIMLAVAVTGILVNVAWGYLNYFKVDIPAAITGPGGKGGDAKASGRSAGAEGGTGGQGGKGSGGPGGNAEADGDHSFARGGDGGNAGQWDGSGGKRTISPGERMNLPSEIWPYGYGGRGADAPEYRRRLEVLTRVRGEFAKAFPDDVRYIDAGVEVVPISWVNKRLEELKEPWRVSLGDGGYILPPLK